MIDTLKKILIILFKSNVSPKNLWIVTVSSLITLIFEIIGTGIFIPIIEIASNIDEEFNFFGFVLSAEKLGLNTFLMIISISLILVISLKSAILIVNSYVLARFWSLVNETVTIYFTKSILLLDYLDFSNMSNSSFTNLIVVEVEKFTELTKYFISFLLEAFVIIFLVGLLFVYNFKASLFIMAFMSIILLVIYFFFKEKTVSWGIERQYYQDHFINNVKSGLMSFLSIKINGGSDFFVSKIEDSLSERNRYIRRQFVFENIPRSLLELTGIFIILLTASIMIYYLGIDKNDTIQYLGLLGITFYRIFPSFNRIITSYNQINFLKAVLNLFDKIFKKQHSEKIFEDYSFEKSIKFSKINFKYNDESYLFRNLDFTINRGDIVGVYGISGKGKSTLLKIIMGILEPLSGDIVVDGKKINKCFNLKNLKFGYVEQNVKIFNASISQNITITENIKNEKWYNEVIKLCQIQHLKQVEENSFLIEDGSNISGGQIQRVGIARALYRNPQILVLDEFTSALDEKNKNLILKSLIDINKNIGTTIIFISHDKTLEKHCNQIINL